MNRWRGLRAPWIPILSLSLAAMAGAQDEEEAAEEPPDLFSRLWQDPTLNGKLHLTYRARYTAKVYQFKDHDDPFPGAVSPEDSDHARQLEERHEDISDQDLDQYFALRLENLPVLEGGSRALNSAGGEASFRYFKDLDGSPAGEEARGFFDRFHGRQALQLQTLLVRLETLNRHLELTLGRQYGHEAEWLHFDGGTARLRGLALFGREVELLGFAGSRVTFYPRSASSLDGLYGGHAKAWVTETTRLKVSDVYYADNSVEAELRQELADLLPCGGWAAVKYRQVNEDPHSVALDVALESAARSFTAYLAYVGKLGRGADDFNFDYTQSARRRRDGDKDFFFNIGDIEPYDEVTLELRQGFLEHWGLFGGGTLHRLRARDRENNYNTDWQEAWLGLDLNDALWKGLSGRGTVRYVHTELPRRRLRLDVDDVIRNGVPDFQLEDVTGDGEPSFLGVEVLLEQDFLRQVAVGSTAVFRAYDYQSNFAELDGLTAASLGGHVRWKALSWLQLHLSYSYDTDYRFVNPDLEAVHTLRLQCMLAW